jgi:hypothetical protein
MLVILLKPSAFGGPVMKTVALVLMILVMLVRTNAVNAQSVVNCTSVIQSIKSGASAISNAASSYWADRENFVGLIYGPSNVAVPNGAQAAVPNTLQAADQVASQANKIKAGMPNLLASFKTLVATAQSQSCLSPAQLSAIVEPTIKLAKGVIFDQLPPETSLEDATVILPRMREMPQP